MPLVTWPTRGREIERMAQQGEGKVHVVTENVWRKNQHGTQYLAFAIGQEVPLEVAEAEGLTGGAENKAVAPPKPRTSRSRKTAKE